jgi:RNA polymerase sigma-70 factor (ECF subfamily)
MVAATETVDWPRALTSCECDAAYARLHPLLLRFAQRELARRIRIAGPELDDLAHQATADALVAIRRRLPEFRGESRFLTWAYKFVLFEVAKKSGRHFWRHPHASMDAEDWERLPDRFGLDASLASESRELLAALRRAVDEVLTEQQRRVFVARILNDIPLDALVQEFGTSRNAIYKTLYDARRKLREQLVAGGHLDDE